MPQHHVLETPKMRKLIIGLILEGKGDTAIAQAVTTRSLKVTRQGIGAFRRRHADVVKPAEAKMIASVADYAISQKVNRIARMDERWRLLQQVRAARAAEMGGEAPGGETGLIIRKLKNIGSGEFVETVTEYAIDTPALAAELALERAAADELGQLPKPTVNVDNRSIVLVRQIIVQGGEVAPIG